MSFIELAGPIMRFRELRGGTRGTDYFYVELDGELVHVARLRGARERFVEEWGGRRRYVVEVPLSEVQGREVYRFSFTRRGAYPYVVKYRVHAGGVVEVWGGPGREVMGSLRFKVIGREGALVDLYERFVPAMAEEVRSICAKRGFGLFFHEHATRTAEAINDPSLGLNASMVLPHEGSRAWSLTQKLQSVHEVWCVVKLIDLLEAQVEGLVQDKALWIAYAQERPTCYLKTRWGEYTLWYQFPVVEQFKAVVIGAARGERTYVRPDIVIFPGRVERAEEVRSTGWQAIDRIVKRALVIDCKAKVGEEDVRQLRAYASLFPKGSRLLVLCLRGIDPLYEYELRRAGWEVFENVAPGMPLSSLKGYLTDSLMALGSVT